MKRAIITGGTGFVGANLARRLLSDGHEVALLVRPGFADWRIADIRGDVSLHVVGLDDRSEIESILRSSRPDWVFHLAAFGAYPTQTDFRQMIDTNFIGTVNLLEGSIATGFEAFINAGSSSEYGYKDHAPRESELVEPNSSYAVTKASATLYCRHIAQKSSLPIRTMRLYSVYGPYEEPSRLMPTLVVRGLRGQLPALVHPETSRDFVDAADVSEAFVRAASVTDQPTGAVYNVGTGVQSTLRDVVDVAREVLNLEVEPEWGTLSARSWDTSVWVADNRQIQESLGWRPTVTVRQGFEALVTWFRDNPAMLARYTDAVISPRPGAA